jgi:hypothetical protein
MNAKTMLVLMKVVRALSAVTALGTVAEVLPPKVGNWAIVAFVVVTALKDFLIKLGDVLDDGKSNQSFKPEV